MISFEEFKKIEMRVGKVRAAELVAGSEKLIKLAVDFGEEEQRSVVAGIAKSFSPDDLIGRQFVFVTNLESKRIMGLESQAMMLAAASEGEIVLMEPIKEVEPGARLS